MKDHGKKDKLPKSIILRNLNFITNLTLGKPLILFQPQITSHTLCSTNILKPLIKYNEIKYHIAENQLKLNT